MSVDRPPKSIAWKKKQQSRKVSKIRTVSTIHRTTQVQLPTGSLPANGNDSDSEAPPLVEDSSEDDENDEQPDEQSRSPLPDASTILRPWLAALIASGAVRSNLSDDEDPEDQPEVEAQAKPVDSTRIVKRCWKSHPGEPNPLDVESDDETPVLEDSESSDDEDEPESIGKASIQPEVQAQAKEPIVTSTRLSADAQSSARASNGLSM